MQLAQLSGPPPSIDLAALWPGVLAIGCAFFGIWLIVGLTSVTARSLRRWRRGETGGGPRGPQRGFAVGVPVVPIDAGGPGRFRIEGVVRTTGADIKLHVEAESIANAKVKAELKGIVVTAIDREPERHEVS